MEENIECSLSVNWLETDGNIVQKDITIRKRSRVALISRDVSASEVLQQMAQKESHSNNQRVVLVPDDIVCYTNLTVGQFLHGMAMAGRNSTQVEQRAIAYLEYFAINASELLLNLTFEQNRLVALIQAMMYDPSVCLLDQPYDMIGDKTYRKLCTQGAFQYLSGNSVVIAASAYHKIGVSCNEYYFMEDGNVIAYYTRRELPRLPKVVTLMQGNIEPMKEGMLKVLAEERGRITFLYQAADSKELLLRIGETGCREFLVEEVSMEEYILEDYARWMR